VRRGRERCFQLKPDALQQARESLDRISRQWDVALGRLKDLVENGGGAGAEGP
jgi:hypothetical protein